MRKQTRLSWIREGQILVQNHEQRPAHFKGRFSDFEPISDPKAIRGRKWEAAGELVFRT